MKKLNYYLIFKVIGFIFLFFTFNSCLSSTENKKELVTSPLALDTAKKIYQQNQEIQTMAARGSIRYQKRKQNHFFRFEVLIKKPNQIYLTVLDPGNRPALRLYVSNNKLTIINYFSKQQIVGKATKENLNQFLPLDFTVEQLLVILTAGQPFSEPSQAQTNVLSPNIPSYLLILEQQDKYWQFNLAETINQEINIKEASYGSLKKFQKPEFIIEYSDYKKTLSNIKDFPYKLNTRTKNKSNFQEFNVNYHEVKINLELDNNLFIPQLRNDFLILDLDKEQLEEI